MEKSSRFFWRVVYFVFFLGSFSVDSLRGLNGFLRGVRVHVYEGKVAVQFDVKYDAETSPLVDLSAIAIRETQGKGRGAFAAARIEKGTFLGSYEGEELDAVAFRERFKAAAPRYVVRVDADRYLDGEARAREAQNFTPALLNHGDRPNVVRYCVQRRPARVDFFVDEDLEAGTELLVDYGQQYWQGREEETKQDLLDRPFFDPEATEDQGAFTEYLKASYENNPEQFRSAYVAIVLSALVFFSQLLVRSYYHNIFLPQPPPPLDNLLRDGTLW